MSEFTSILSLIWRPENATEVWRPETQIWRPEN